MPHQNSPQAGAFGAAEVADGVLDDRHDRMIRQAIADVQNMLALSIHQTVAELSSSRGMTIVGLWFQVLPASQWVL
jgi:hypothetical protein